MCVCVSVSSANALLILHYSSQRPVVQEEKGRGRQHDDSLSFSCTPSVLTTSRVRATLAYGDAGSNYKAITAPVNSVL